MVAISEADEGEGEGGTDCGIVEVKVTLAVVVEELVKNGNVVTGVNLDLRNCCLGSVEVDSDQLVHDKLVTGCFQFLQFLRLGRIICCLETEKSRLKVVVAEKLF